MARLEIPLSYRTLHTTGDDVLHAELKLQVKDDQGAWRPIDFRVDPGTEMTTMPAWRATGLDLPIPKRPVRGLALDGQEVRRGLLRARIVGLDATEYVFPCYFLGDPNIPWAAAKNLLGLTGVINQVRLTFDGTPSARPRGYSSWRRSERDPPLPGFDHTRPTFPHDGRDDRLTDTASTVVLAILS